MISASNEQLQQLLEYTLLKPDCHIWWISKMQSGCEDALEERYAIKFCFKLGKNATETYGMLHTAFGRSCMNRASVFEWHKRFKEEASTLQIGSVAFPPGQCTSRQLHPCHRLFDQNGHQDSSSPSHSSDLAPCDFWLFPKLGGCHYETIEKKKEAVMKVIDMLTQEDFHGALQKLLEEYNKCIAARGDYFEGD